jgi:hypothetical protein
VIALFIHVPSNADSSTTLFWKKCFLKFLGFFLKKVLFSKICFEKPLLKIFGSMSLFGIYVINFNWHCMGPIEKAVLCWCRCYLHTYKYFLMYMLLFSYALLGSMLFNKLNLLKLVQGIWKPLKILLWGIRKYKNLFNYWQHFDNFYPCKAIIIKKVLKLRSIAKLMAFDGSILFFMTNL